MNVFWLNSPLPENESKLLQLCLQAHHDSALRPNISSVNVQNSAAGSGDFSKAVIAGLSATGGLHAPLRETYVFLTSDQGIAQVPEAIKRNVKIPGFGNSFVKGKVDPAWEKVDLHLKEHFPKIYGRIYAVVDLLHKAGKPVFPNASMYTCATAVEIGMPPHILPWLFLSGRLNAWASLFLGQVLPQPKEQKE